MSKKLNALMLAGLIGLLIVAIGLSFLFGLDNPVAWILILVLIGIVFLYRHNAERRQLKWKPEYSVGIATLDDDHKKLIKLLNKFQTAYEYDTGDQFERQALDELIDYTRYHFKREEQLMKQHGYPDLEAHKLKHVEMIDQVDHFVADYEKRGHEALEPVADFLKEWLVNHINGTDKQYGPYLSGKGVS